MCASAHASACFALVNTLTKIGQCCLLELWIWISILKRKMWRVLGVKVCERRFFRSTLILLTGHVCNMEWRCFCPPGVDVRSLLVSPTTGPARVWLNWNEQSKHGSLQLMRRCVVPWTFVHVNCRNSECRVSSLWLHHQLLFSLALCSQKV